jgi:glycine/D-amino acid oxidase-like deaminating enzyme
MKILVVGQGVAGSMLAWQLRQNRHDVVLADPGGKCASRVAAGVLTPITGKRFAASWEYPRLYAGAVAAYKELGQYFGKTFFYPRETIRIFRSAEERALWDKKKSRLDFLPFIKEDLPARALPEPWQDPFGSMILIQGGWCDAESLLEDLEHFFLDHGILRRGTLSHADITAENSRVTWRNEPFDHVVFCEGYHIRHNPFFSRVPFEHVKGEILTIETGASVPEQSILNFGKWIVPYPDGSLRCGSTYDWYDLTDTPTGAAREHILESLRNQFSINVTVTGQQAGVRPVCKDMKPVLGPHPRHRRVWVFNGLGAKGILRAPYLAQHLVNVLEKKETLWEEVNCARFWDDA